METVDRRIEGDGISESQWAASSWLTDLPLSNFASLVGRSRRVVVISPHPDDEVLACGGLMVEAVRHAIPVEVVSVTNGELCYPQLAPADCAHIGQRRKNELANAIKALGLDVSCISSWEIPDGQIGRFYSVVHDRLLDTVSCEDLLVAPWEWDGHPDHEACGSVALKVAAARQCQLLRYPVWGWHWSAPGASVGLVHQAAIGLCLDVEQRRVKHRAVREFVSQIQIGAEVSQPILPPSVLARFERDVEVYLT